MKRRLGLGIDVGSTTVKTAAVDLDQKKLLFSRYERHYARQEETVEKLLHEVKEEFSDETLLAAVCGSGGKPIAQALSIPYVQEVVANAAAVRILYPGVHTAIELGGQDAKVVFFYEDKETHKTQVSDMRMNGSCAGGTGAFIDEMAALLCVSAEEFEELASQGKQVFDISGRCGVFAKTDIQPLLIQGAKKEDIALSVYHAIAKQTIGGLSQGLELKPPVIFEGGPLTFHPTLVRVFRERLHLKDGEWIVPDHPETIVAFGTALAADQMREKNKEEQKSNHSSLTKTATADELIGRLHSAPRSHHTSKGKPFFSSKKEQEEFTLRHDKELRFPALATPQKDGTLPVFMGIDSGSTTSKIVLINEKEELIDRFYANNKGNSLQVIQEGILDLQKKYEKQGITLRILGVGTTGYGEQMIAKALHADYHIVETVAHAQACLSYYPDATFVLDIGGQDMKAIWLRDGIITNIMLNEACSSGCGSFLENFAETLSIPVDKIADVAFRSKDPAVLGSRCTVFMNSTIIHEQREGKSPDDIMAGLCRSIIENVFTKVVRISNTESLGNHIVVQGGTFRNRAVLRALEEYLNINVSLAPYPGEMGALGAAILTRRQAEEKKEKEALSTYPATSFIGFSSLSQFKSVTKTGVSCPYCANHCSRTIVSFSTGGTWVTGNRCERGEQTDASPASSPKDTVQQGEDLFDLRGKLLFQSYPCEMVSSPKDQVIGLPRVLEFWDSMPFWSTFFRALGFKIKFSHESNQKLYEKGLPYVASDTICFPAKLVHGHIQDLAEQKVDRIFMPFVMHMPPEGVDKKSPYVCSVVMGYPLVVQSSQKPKERYGIPFDTPVFHWFQEKDRRRQISDYAVKSLNVTKEEANQAFDQGEKAILSFRGTLKDKAQAIIDKARKEGKFVVVLAGRPYQTDPAVSHRISHLFTKQGISVVTADSLPGLEQVDLKNTRIEITNNFHTRMLASAVLAAKDDTLEYVQLVSFGCGHDAILSDEIVRIMTETSEKSPLILKVDESEASGSLRIRVQSFLETVRIRRKKLKKNDTGQEKTSNDNTSLATDNTGLSITIQPSLNTFYKGKDLPSPSPVKFYKSDKKKRTVLLPNISHEVAVLLKALFTEQGFKVKTIPIGSIEQIHLGKRYVHNDICFPCQMVIGELIGELKTGKYQQDEVAVGMVKFQCDCRMSHYAGLLRKALDSAGFQNVPIVTSDFGDSKDMHPGIYVLGVKTAVEAVWAFMMLDDLTSLCRKMRPYELHPGETNKVYKDCVNRIAQAIPEGVSGMKKAFSSCIDAMCAVPYDRSHRKPRVLVTGELLVTYHPGSNFHVEEYLEKNGMETIFPRVTDQLRKDFDATKCEIHDYHANIFPYPYIVTALFDTVQNSLAKISSRHPLYEKSISPVEMYQGVKDLIPETLSCGEGWLMAAEIDHYAREGVRSFVILQPFGCLPNHVCGRGVIRKLKDRYPGIQILPLDLDPDTSFANVENRLQMLIMNEEEPKQHPVSKDERVSA